MTLPDLWVFGGVAFVESPDDNLLVLLGEYDLAVVACQLIGQKQPMMNMVDGMSPGYPIEISERSRQPRRKRADQPVGSLSRLTKGGQCLLVEVNESRGFHPLDSTNARRCADLLVVVDGRYGA